MSSTRCCTLSCSPQSFLGGGGGGAFVRRNGYCRTSVLLQSPNCTLRVGDVLMGYWRVEFNAYIVEPGAKRLKLIIGK